MMNPASAGVYDFIDITVSGRSQWTGFQGAPRTSYLSITSPAFAKFGSKRSHYNPGLRTGTGLAVNPTVGTGKLKHALGGQLLGDEYGAFRKVSFSGTYALHLPLSSKVNLSFGTKIGISNNTFIADRAQVLDQATDKTYLDFTANATNRNILDIGVGMYLYSEKFFFGIAGDQLTTNMVSFGNSSSNFDPQIYLNATGGVKLKVNDHLTITPAFLVKYMNPAPISIDASIQFEYQKRFWIGATYRNQDAIVGMCGLNINRLVKIGYSYDYNISRFNQNSAGGHELVLGIMLR